MIISAYNDARGNHASLTVDLDENYFPQKYTVSVNYSKELSRAFPGTKRGAAQAKNYYRNYVSIFGKTGTGGGVNNAEHR